MDDLLTGGCAGRTKLRSPIIWFGGKGLMVSRLLPLVPPHRQYVEVFGGGASMLFAKTPAPVETYNDLDEGLVNFYRVLRDPEMFGRFYHHVTLTPYSRNEYAVSLAALDAASDPIDRAYHWYVVCRFSFGGHFGQSFGTTIDTSTRGMASRCSSWLSILEMLPSLHERMMRVQIESQPFDTILSRYDTPGTFAYLDPPYILATRSSGGYAHEMSDDDHRRLVARLLDYPAMVMLSGYRHAIYAPLEAAGWQRQDFHTACMCAGRTRASGLRGAGSALGKHPRVESVWRNPACVAACHAAASDTTK